MAASAGKHQPDPGFHTFASGAFGEFRGLESFMIHLQSLMIAAVMALAAAPETRPVDPARVTAPPAADQPLDPRIKSDRITRSDLPPLPQRVLLPLPPDHRMARKAAQVPISPEHFERAQAAITRGLAFVRSAQSPDGAWLPGFGALPTDSTDKPSPVSVAVTALALKAVAQADLANTAKDDEQFRRALRIVLSAQKSDGSFEGGQLGSYVTSAAVMALAAIDEREHHDPIADGLAWLQRAQWDQSEGLDASQDWFGGAGYGNHGRPDLSNTQTMLDAMYDAGLCPDEPAFQKAVAFLSRAQNLKAANPSPWSGDDGGFIYTPANGGESFASEAAGEGRHGEKIAADQPRSLRSYGSMTYAGFKSMLYAGLSADDLRVRAAFDWICRNWTFDENPGLGRQGLFYYYHTMSRALRVSQQHVITDAKGVAHNWRQELIDSLAQRQAEDGGWTNEADRWMEGQSIMATLYAVLSLEECLKPVNP
jgi:squalene-hopene/tetraprenyl-beta-curcumene cyclase